MKELFPMSQLKQQNRTFEMKDKNSFSFKRGAAFF